MKLHSVMILGVAGSLAAGGFEWTRARAGREIAWIYTFEWPLFALMGIYLWWQLLHGDAGSPRSERRRRRRRDLGRGRLGHTRHTRHTVDSHDPDLVAWQDYLSRLQASDPPGGPPPAGAQA